MLLFASVLTKPIKQQALVYIFLMHYAKKTNKFLLRKMSIYENNTQNLSEEYPLRILLAER